MLDNSSNITLRNIVVRGANPNAGPLNGAYNQDYEAQHGIQFSRSSGLVDGVTVSDTFGDLVSISEWSHNVRVRNSALLRNGRQGVNIDGTTDVVVVNNTVGDTGRSLFDLEPPTVKREVVHRVLIADNDVGRANGAFIAALGRGEVSDVTVQGNRLAMSATSPQARP